jgi:hypothetical protein
MPREIVLHKDRQKLYVDEDKRRELASWLSIELEDAFSSRSALESQWREDLRLYEGVPKREVSDFPVENAPNIELTLAALAADSIYAQAVDLIFSTSPLVTCRPVPKRKDDKETIDDCKAIQRFVNWIAENEAKIRSPAEDLVIDDVQLGTGVLYIPWIERQKKTRTAKVIARQPIIYCMPIEDVIVPGGSYGDVEKLPWIGLRFWLTKNEIVERGGQNGWDIDGVQTAGAKDWVRTRREVLGRQYEGIIRKGDLYDIYDIYCFYDIDDDGIAEDLYVVYNHTGRKVLRVDYNPFDRRPLEKAVYQRRAHLFYGLGVVRMMKPYQEHLTDFFNWASLNALLANCRMWATREGVVPDNIKIWPNKQIPCKDPDSDIKELRMSDVYSSNFHIMAMLMQFGEKRVGVNEMSLPRTAQVMGSRTPGITALSLLQQANKRFTPAFDGIRQTIAAALRQCIYRYQERLLAGDEQVEEHIIQVLGPADGIRVINLLRDKSFDEHVAIELTASSAAANREVDRQNAMMLVNILAQYYQRTLELVAIAANPQTPEPVREVAKKIASSAGEVIDRTIRTFDQVRDPAAFIIEVEETLDNIEGISQEGMAGLLEMLGPYIEGSQAPQIEMPGGMQ